MIDQYRLWYRSEQTMYDMQGIQMNQGIDYDMIQNMATTIIHIYIYIYVYTQYIYIYIYMYQYSAASPPAGAPASARGGLLRPTKYNNNTSSPKLIPTPGFLPPGYSLFSSAFLCFLPPGEILKSGVGITFGVPIILLIIIKIIISIIIITKIISMLLIIIIVLIIIIKCIYIYICT